MTVRRISAGAGLMLVCAFLLATSARADDARVPAPPLDPQVVTDARHVAIGFYGVTLQGLDVRDNSFHADFFMWMRWRGDADPTTTMELTNNIERWGVTKAAVYKEPRILPSGEKIQIFRIQGKFFQPLNLDRFPLDHHQLSIKVEDTTRTEADLTYLPDHRDTGVDPGVVQPGWKVTRASVRVEPHYYETSFGEEGTSKADSTYSAAIYSIDIKRPYTFFVWKLLFPLAIVLFLGLSALFVDPTQIEFRVAVAPAALISLVFLQDTYSATLPALGTLVLLDKIYVLAYAIVLFTLGGTIVSGAWAKSEAPEALHRASRLDHVVAAVSIVGFALGVLLLVL